MDGWRGEENVSNRRILLETRGLSKSFGSLAAVKDVSVQVAEGEVHAIIGPNGAGKTTFFNLLSGELSASSGTLHFDGRDVTGWPPERLANAGVGRSFQHSSVFENLSVHENLRLAVQTKFPKSFGFFRPAERYLDIESRVINVLRDLSLDVPRQTQAGELSHGEQRQLEIGMLMAISPKIMLLDEPTSGMSRNETLELIEILRRLSAQHTLVLVEHDMDVVFELADRITVLVNGTVLASGAPAAIRADSDVRSAYLGHDG
jgi:branched-chain amino acid transport system ATP-binding protein